MLNKISRLCMVAAQGPLLIAAAAVLLLVGTALGKAAEPKALQPQKPAPATTAPATVSTGAIPVTDIATQATGVANLIRKFNTQLAPNPQIETIRTQLPEISKNVASDLSEIRRQLQSQPTLSMLQAGQVLWEKRQRELMGWLNLLTRRATELQKDLSDLSELEKRWGQTGEMAKASKAPGPILQEIDAVLTMIGEVQTPMETQRAEILDLQSRVSQEVAACGTALAEIGQAQQKALGGILKRENPPVWSPDLWVTWQGAEIIVPNSQLVSEQVTNWTLSDQLRRIDLPAGVNYGADPKRVIELMEGVARAHPHVLREPAPRAFFTGFGDSSVNFELRAWTDQFGNWFQIRSELAAALYGAIYEAGMSFPFPQREVRVLGDADTGKNSSALKGEKA